MFDDRAGYVPLDRDRGRNSRGGGWERFRLPFQCKIEHLIDPFHRVDIQTVFDILRNLRQILNVVFGNQDCFYTSAVRRQQFFLESADRKHLAPQRDFPRHRHRLLERQYP